MAIEVFNRYEHKYMLDREAYAYYGYVECDFECEFNLNYE